MTTMTPGPLCILIFHFFFFLLSSTVHSKPPINQYKGLTVELFHHNRWRPAHNSTSTKLDHMRDELEISSLSDFRYFSNATVASKILGMESEVIKVENSYSMKLSIGTPPLRLVATIDTGSDLSWTQCEPCRDCYKQELPIFDPRRSSSYNSVDRSSDFCKALDESKIRNNDESSNQCKYSLRYADGRTSEGVIAAETLTFDSISGGGGKVTIPFIGFGCGHANRGSHPKEISGFIGLGRGPASLVSQLGATYGNRFSYCFQPRRYRQFTSKLKFGKDAVFLGTAETIQRTPLLHGHDPTFYYLKLEDISVNNKRLNVLTESASPSTPPPTDDGGFIIDSGTTITYLAPPIYAVLESALRVAIVGLQETRDSKKFPLCYKFDESVNPNALPSVTFHFGGGANWPLSYTSTFVVSEKMFLCTAFLPSPLSLSILGNVAQENMYVEYDLGNNVLSFASTDCTRG